MLVRWFGLRGVKMGEDGDLFIAVITTAFSRLKHHHSGSLNYDIIDP